MKALLAEVTELVKPKNETIDNLTLIDDENERNEKVEEKTK